MFVLLRVVVCFLWFVVRRFALFSCLVVRCGVLLRIRFVVCIDRVLLFVVHWFVLVVL